MSKNVKINQVRIVNNEELLKYDASDCLNPTRIFVTKYNVFPNILGLNPSEDLRKCVGGITFNFDIEKTINLLLDENYEIEVNRVEDIDEEGNLYNKRVVILIPKCECLIYSREEILFDNTNTNRNSDFHEFYYSDYSKIKHIVNLVWEKSFTKIDTTYKTNLYTITQTQTSFKLTPKLIKPVNIDINTNYNDDFIKADNTISKFISEKDTHGIVILNGMMGTGKTYYIRHLIESNPDVNFILGTRSIAESLSEPSFISFLSENTNSVLILEDCENIVKKRSMNESSAITNLLNIGDGLLSDSLKIKIIVTFNTDLKNVDTALQRKGRMKYLYTFENLSLDKTKKMFEKIGKKIPDNLKTGLSLAEIYNYDEDNNNDLVNSKTIGF